MAETRKLAAFTAVDVVGYSRLMGEDEAGTARSVREHREAALRRSPHGVKDFYFTTPIARASRTIAERSALAKGRLAQAAE